jgi:predicted NBD/HSP70 family sugar kinase
VPTPNYRQTRVPPTSAGNLLWLIRSGQARTRADVQTITGLSRSTVAARLDALIGAGYLRDSTRDSSTGGRPAALLEFDATVKVVLAADLGATHARLAAMEVSGDVLATCSDALRIADGPKLVLDWVASQFQAMLAGIGRQPADVCGIGVGVPGPVEFDVGRVRKPPIMPGWDDYPIIQHLQHLSPDGPVLVDNDANLMALGEQAVCFPDCPAFVLVKVATGIGAGVVTNGAVYRGIDGGAGDIGHIRLHGYDDLRCMCGAYGCLAAVASGAALAHRLKDAGGAESSRDMVRLIAAGDPDACRLAREAGQQVGEVLATVVCLLNPGVLVIAGDLAETHFVTGVREVLYQRALPRATQHLQVAIGQLGELAAIMGAHAMVVEDVFSPAAVDARLDTAASR